MNKNLGWFIAAKFAGALSEMTHISDNKTFLRSQDNFDEILNPAYRKNSLSFEKLKKKLNKNSFNSCTNFIKYKLFNKKSIKKFQNINQCKRSIKLWTTDFEFNSNKEILQLSSFENHIKISPHHWTRQLVTLFSRAIHCYNLLEKNCYFARFGHGVV